MRITPILLLALLLPGRDALAFDPVPVAGRQGMVVSAQSLATEAGVEVLRQGGNAVDAAVAVGYALAVTYPAAGNLGGGGFMTLRLADGSVHFLDFREKAPMAATAGMFLDAQGQVVKGRSTDTWLAVGVPGSIAGLEAARARWGRLPRGAALAPAIRLAREGFVLGAGDASLFAVAAPGLAKDPAAAAIFTRDGKPLGPGDHLVQADLARTLTQLAESGPDAFYRGPLGAALVAASQAGGGLIDQVDLERYRVRDPRPIECDYRGYHVISAPPPSSGGVVLCEALGILEGYDLRGMGFHGAAAVHVTAEAMRRAFMDRNNRLGDPDFVRNPVQALLDPAYAARLRTGIDPDRATPTASLKPGAPEAGPPEGQNTTHYAVVDAAGNAVAVTYTLNEWFGVRKVAPGTGIVLNNEMDDFTAQPGQPNMFGLVQGVANAVAPGKTPLSSMSPTILTKDGKLVAVLGSPGGPRIITTVLNLVLNLVDYGMTVQEAVDAPRLHHQALPDTIFAERFALSPDTRSLLEARGHRITDSAPWGIAEAILVGAPRLGPAPPGNSAQSLYLGDAQASGMTLFGAHDPRGGAGSAAGD
jgi:gamma-glutamyltranspeptidase/glutathione hydrolase